MLFTIDHVKHDISIRDQHPPPPATLCKTRQYFYKDFLPSQVKTESLDVVKYLLNIA